MQEKLKFIYSEKATKFCEISTLLLSNVVPVKSKVEIFQNSVDFSEYMNLSRKIGKKKSWEGTCDQKNQLKLGWPFRNRTKCYLLDAQSHIPLLWSRHDTVQWVDIVSESIFLHKIVVPFLEYLYCVMKITLIAQLREY